MRAISTKSSRKGKKRIKDEDYSRARNASPLLAFAFALFPIWGIKIEKRKMQREMSSLKRCVVYQNRACSPLVSSATRNLYGARIVQRATRVKKVKAKVPFLMLHDHFKTG